MSRFRSKYRAGEWVEVRSEKEILASLDDSGALDNLPFMPEMLRYCGKRFRVFASAHKTCDTVHKTGGRRMRDAVHLEDMRCDGSAHGGCQARCSIFWKEAWLKPAAPSHAGVPGSTAVELRTAAQSTAAASLGRFTRRPAPATAYVCQATRLFEATSALTTWSPMQYVADVRSGNETLLEAAKVLFLHSVFSLRGLKRGHRLWRWLYELAHRAIRGTGQPYAVGAIPSGSPTPDIRTEIAVGSIVEVKSHQAILQTLDTRNRNKGLSFDKELVRYCGQSFKVISRVEKIIDESTGEMLRLPRPSLVLEGTYCTSRYSERRLLCPRRLTPFWREAWLCPKADVPCTPELERTAPIAGPMR